MKNTPHPWIRMFNIVKMAILTKVCYIFNIIPIKILVRFFYFIEMVNQFIKFIWNCEVPSTQNHFENEQSWRTHLSQFQNLLWWHCSFAKLCLTLCDSMNYSTPGFPFLHYLLEFAQTHVHRVSDVIQPSHPLFSCSPLTFNLSQHQGLFQWVSSSHQVAKVLELQLDIIMKTM